MQSSESADTEGMSQETLEPLLEYSLTSEKSDYPEIARSCKPKLVLSYVERLHEADREGEISASSQLFQPS
jgi:hypothetical protein